MPGVTVRGEAARAPLDAPSRGKGFSVQEVLTRGHTRQPFLALSLFL